MVIPKGVFPLIFEIFCKWTKHLTNMLKMTIPMKMFANYHLCDNLSNFKQSEKIKCKITLTYNVHQNDANNHIMQFLTIFRTIYLSRLNKARICTNWQFIIIMIPKGVFTHISKIYCKWTNYFTSMLHVTFSCYRCYR